MWGSHYAQTTQQKREQQGQITHWRIFAASKNSNEKTKAFALVHGVLLSLC
jgi:hypothetical protein